MISYERSRTSLSILLWLSLFCPKLYFYPRTCFQGKLELFHLTKGKSFRDTDSIVAGLQPLTSWMTTCALPPCFNPCSISRMTWWELIEQELREKNLGWLTLPSLFFRQEKKFCWIRKKNLKSNFSAESKTAKKGILIFSNFDKIQFGFFYFLPLSLSLSPPPPISLFLSQPFIWKDVFQIGIPQRTFRFEKRKTFFQDIFAEILKNVIYFSSSSSDWMVSNENLTTQPETEFLLNILN